MNEKRRFILLLLILIFQIAFIIFMRFWYERVFT
jgi:hypothetical protein